MKLAETILLPRSPLVGTSLKELRFRDRYGLQVLAINRHGMRFLTKLSELRLETGDMLLVQGPAWGVTLAEEDGVLLVLRGVEGERPNFAKAPLSALIFVGALTLAGADVVALPVAALIGSLLVFLTRCLTPDEAYRAVEWRVLILIGCMLALGKAMDSTGAATYLASGIVNAFENAGPVWLLSGFFALTVLLTQPMSNQAAAVVVIPVALATALQVGLDPRPFAMMVTVAASCSYLTPLEPSCVLVYGPGRYRFSDFIKAGFFLTLLIYLIAIVMVPRVWPL
jgi:di/tricarboxylate transporter